MNRHAAKRKKIEIFTDGACAGNPGPGGWGALLRHGERERELFGGAVDTTNNRMELMAAIEALRALKHDCEIDLYTDSQYLRRGVTEWLAIWKRNGWRTSSRRPVKNADLWQALDAGIGSHEIRWHWVKGHSGHEGNEHADRLANRGMQAVRGLDGASS